MANLNIGDPVIPLSLPGVDGKDYSLESYQAKPIIAVIFSCNHCPYVRAWEGRMIDIQAAYAEKGVQFLVISSNDASQYPADSFPMMKERAEQLGFNFPYLYDESQEIARAYGAQRTPEVFLFDSDRRLRYHGAIDDNYEDPEAVSAHHLIDALDALLAGQSPAVAATPPVGCTIKWKPN